MIIQEFKIKIKYINHIGGNRNIGRPIYRDIQKTPSEDKMMLINCKKI